MKKILLPAIVFIAGISIASAQIPKGSLLLGGNLNYNSGKITNSSNDESKQWSYGISPVAGTFVKDNIAVGGSLSYGKIHSGSGDNSHDVDSYGAGLFVRKYINLGSSNFFAFLQGGLNANFSKAEDRSPVTLVTTKETDIDLALTPGIAYAISKAFHLELGFSQLGAISYSSIKSESSSPGNTYKSNSFGISSSLSNSSPAFYIGFRVLLRK